jgi:HAD superfamily hydrolase (TIGR01509 family)
MRFPITSKQHFLFDLDGTLVDSNEFHGLAFREVLGRSAPDRLAGFDYETVKGQATRAVFESFGFKDEAQITALTAAKQSAYSSAIARSGLPLIRGAREILDFLASLDKKLHIVSAGGRRSVEEALRAAKIRHYFSSVTTSDDVTHSKPDPEIYRKCLEANHAPAGDCLAIEDSDSGIAASTGAGIDSVLVNDCGKSVSSVSVDCEIYPSLEEFSVRIIEMFGVRQ